MKDVLIHITENITENITEWYQVYVLDIGRWVAACCMNEMHTIDSSTIATRYADAVAEAAEG